MHPKQNRGKPCKSFYKCSYSNLQQAARRSVARAQASESKKLGREVKFILTSVAFVFTGVELFTGLG